MGVGGRSQRAAMERLVRLAAALWKAGPDGVDADVLVEVGGWTGQPDANREQLARDLRQLSRLGWLVDNVSEEGATARWRMVTVDNRLRVKLSPEQRAALQRAGMVADRPDLLARLGLQGSGDALDPPVRTEPPPANTELAAVLAALTQHSRVGFVYNGRARVADPQSILPRAGRWTLVAVEVGQEDPKYFVVDRMQEVDPLGPGTAVVRGRAPRAGLDPLAWETDPSIEVQVSTSTAFRQDVEALLGTPTRVDHGDVTRPDREVRLTYDVTNEAAFRARVYELGLRVRVLGPTAFRERMLEELRAIAGGVA